MQGFKDAVSNIYIDDCVSNFYLLKKNEDEWAPFFPHLGLAALYRSVFSSFWRKSIALYK